MPYPDRERDADFNDARVRISDSGPGFGAENPKELSSPKAPKRKPYPERGKHSSKRLQEPGVTSGTSKTSLTLKDDPPTVALYERPPEPLSDVQVNQSLWTASQRTTLTPGTTEEQSPQAPKWKDPPSGVWYAGDKHLHNEGQGAHPELKSAPVLDTASNSGISDQDAISDASDVSDRTFEKRVAEEIQSTWVLTLSMRFRDGTQREKFFITYMRKSNVWLHVTVSVDYGNPEEGSLEADLSQLAYQRDKNLFIYKAVRQSLNEIHFFDTITNLRLETNDEQLHIHVAEDTHEIIPYPPLYNLGHLQLNFHGYLQVREEDVHFETHLSGFVYKVRVSGQIYVKKEIPSTDNVQEFIYEIEALAFLRQSKSIINLAGIVVATIDSVECVTGVLLEYASGGALNDFFYEHEKDDLDWDTRLTWIRQVVQAIADLHEAGFVQGDCTLSNVVLDCDGNARVVDINRRGCPIGWEPPEFRGKIQSGQRISMYIGNKSDLYQLGMVIWAIATQIEEPDRADRPLTLDDPETPQELRDVVNTCLSDNPFDRKPASVLLTMLPQVKSMSKLPVFKPKPVNIMTLKDRSAAVTHDDVSGVYDHAMGNIGQIGQPQVDSSVDPFDETDAQLEPDDFALSLFHQDSGLEIDAADLRRSRSANVSRPPSDIEMTLEEQVDRKFGLPHPDSGFSGEALSSMVNSLNPSTQREPKGQ